MFDFDATTLIFMDFKASRVALDARKRKKRNKKGILKTKMGGCMILYMVYWNQQGDLVVQEPTKENDFKLHTFMLSHTALSGCGRYLGLIIVLEGRTTFFRIPSIAGLVFILVTIAAALTLGRCALWGRTAWPRCRTLVITRSVYALLVPVR